MSHPPKPAVLVVEDEPLLLLDDMCLFEEAGFEAIPAANAAEAICILEERLDIRVVITDIGMPGRMDGLSLCATIRDRWPPIELIVVSGQPRPAPSELPPRSLFLAKPYDSKQMLAALRGFATATPSQHTA
ncbi:response regulator [Methyloferula stellata]|uniref:response regulator n=1 Tax=Methyloferula stellata TaxID=876270 RepID=UPI00058D0F1E|nr:response regulator [Methyloferula stellata]